MAFIPLEIIVVTVSKSVFYYPQLPFHPLGGDIVPVETTWHMLILLSRQGADTLPARIPAFLINTLLLSDKQRKFLKCLWRSWQGERYRKAWEIRGDDLLPCVCSFYVSCQEQSQAVERLCPQQGPHAAPRSYVLLVTRINTGPPWFPAGQGRCTGPGPSGQQAGEEAVVRVCLMLPARFCHPTFSLSKTS